MRSLVLGSIAACVIIMGSGPISAQTPILMGTGYTAPTPIRVTPGQIVTIYVSTKTVLPALNPTIRATSVPLPISLGGLSVTVRQVSNSDPAVFNTYAAPLLSVAQFKNCLDASSSSPSCIVTALTVQIPYEIKPDISRGQVGSVLNADLTVNDNGTESVHSPIQPIPPDNIRVLTNCDVDAITGVQLYSLSFQACSSITAHADGTLITYDSPAQPGEEIVIYAFGLGPTSPTPKTGSVSPTPAAALVLPLSLQFDFRPNATPSQPWVNPLVTSATTPQTPVFVGLTPGQVGLYQINVRLPNSFPAIPPCQQNFAGKTVHFIGVVQTNLTIDIGAQSSFDGAAICVKSPQ